MTLHTLRKMLWTQTWNIFSCLKTIKAMTLVRKLVECALKTWTLKCWQFILWLAPGWQRPKKIMSQHRSIRSHAVQRDFVFQRRPYPIQLWFLHLAFVLLFSRWVWKIRRDFLLTTPTERNNPRSVFVFSDEIASCFAEYKICFALRSFNGWFIRYSREAW